MKNGEIMLKCLCNLNNQTENKSQNITWFQLPTKAKYTPRLSSVWLEKLPWTYRSTIEAIQCADLYEEESQQQLLANQHESPYTLSGIYDYSICTKSDGSDNIRKK